MDKKNQVLMRSMGVFVLGLMFLITFMAGTSLAMDAYLRADTFTKTMPDGTIITMWGYASCDSTFTTCSTATVPGPTLTATAGDTVNIHVKNNLTGSYTEPTSIVIPGQTATINPVWINPTTGAIVSTGSRPVGDVT